MTVPVTLINKVNTFTPLDYDKLYKELNNYGVTLDEDPTSVGLSSLNQKIANIDSQKTRIGGILTSAYRNEDVITLVMNDISRTLEKEKSALVKDEEIVKLSNQSLRDAAVNRKLSELLDLKGEVEGFYLQARTFTKVVQHVFNMLDSTNKNISRQLTTIQTMISLNEIARTDDFK